MQFLNPVKQDNVDHHITKLAFFNNDARLELGDGRAVVLKYANLGVYEIWKDGVLFYFEKHPNLCGTGPRLVDAMIESAQMIAHTIEHDSVLDRSEMTTDCYEQLVALQRYFSVSYPLKCPHVS